MSDIKELKKQIQSLEQEVERLNEELHLVATPSIESEAKSLNETKVMVQDEVDRRTRNMQLVMEQAAQANKNKTAFLERVSYDLLTPMNTILGMTNLVLDTELTTQQKRYLELVSVSADNLLGVIDNILDFSKIELGKLEFEFNSFNLMESLEYELYAHQLKAKQKGVALRINCEPGVSSVIECDESRFLQVVSNLVDNGVSYTSRGEVIVEISSKGFNSDGYSLIQVSVSDTGIGIQPAKQQIITESFNLGAVPPSGESDSNLLGLIIAGHLVKLAGGEIGIESSGMEKGTTVWFRWPVTIPIETDAAPVDLEGAVQSSISNINKLEGIKVLVAEDDPASRLFVETILKPSGAQVTSVVDGEDAFKAFLKDDFQLILMDVQMPVMTGIECTKKIRQYEKVHGGHVLIIALTALAMQGDKQRCLRVGMDDYLAKPIDKNLLLDILNRHFGRWALLAGDIPEELKNSLLTAGWEVTSVESGKSAVYEATVSFYSLVIIDVSTPNSGYLETVNNVKRMSAHTGEKQFFIGVGSKSGETKAGFDAILPDDVDNATFIKAIQDIFEV